jgi:hypothetical protein
VVDVIKMREDKLLSKEQKMAEIKNVALVAAIKAVGEEQAAVDLVQGTKNREYRKGRNMRVSAYQEALKDLPEFKQLEAKAKAIIAKKLQNGK